MLKYSSVWGGALLLLLLGLPRVAIISLLMSTSLLTLSVSSPALAQTSDTRKIEADRLLLQGYKEVEKKQWKTALQLLQQSLGLYEQLSDKQGQARGWLLLGITFLGLYDMGRSSEAAQKALTIAQEIKDSDLVVNAENLLKVVGRVSLQPPVSKQSDDARKTEANRLFKEGYELFDKKQWKAAVQLLQKALEIYKQLGDERYQGGVTLVLGIAHWQLGDFVVSREYLQQASIITKKFIDPKSERKLETILKIVSLPRDVAEIIQGYDKYSIQRQIDSLEKLLDFARMDGGNQKTEAFLLVRLGAAYFFSGETQKATQYCQQALDIAKIIGEAEIEKGSLGCLDGVNASKNEKGQKYLRAHQFQIKGIQQNSTGQYLDAVQSFQNALSLYQDLQEPGYEVGALRNLGEAYMRLGDPLKAIEYTQKALDLAQKLKAHEAEGNILALLGLIYISQGNYLKANEYLHRAHKIAKSFKERGLERDILNALSRSYFVLNDSVSSVKYAQEALAIATKTGDRRGQSRALQILGLNSTLQKKFGEAEDFFRRSIQIEESIRFGLNDSEKVGLSNTQQDVYESLQFILTILQRPNQALEVAERSKARALLELLSKRTQGLKISEVIVPSPNLEQIKRIAKEQKATLVQYSVGQSSLLFIWVINPNGEVVQRLVNIQKKTNSSLTQLPLSTHKAEQSELTQLVASTRGAMGVTSTNFRESGKLTFQADPSQMNRQLKRLHQVLIEPIADLLPTDPNQPVIFIPQDALFFVPFPALRDANGKYLIEQHTILTAPSIQVLDLTRQQKSKIAGSSGALVVGNPVMPRGFAPLPNAEAEAKAISALFNTQPLLGAQATKATVIQKMSQARVIHLATHGLLDDVRGLGSAIALAPSGKDDGLLTAEEILDMKLNAELVVLSACNTGRGRLTGDGVIGLSRSLIAAGVPSVLVSLWSVPDDSTLVLMSEFYRNLQKHPNKAQALRNAMLTMIQENRNPIDWAGFTLIGEAE